MSVCRPFSITRYLPTSFLTSDSVARGVAVNSLGADT